MAITENMGKESLFNNAKVLHAYLECSDEIQAGVRDLLGIVFDENADGVERKMALTTIADALFPHLYKDQLGMDLEESERDAADHDPEFAEVVKELDSEEDAFASRLAQEMRKRNMTQTELAEKVGVGQPAISNMLNRSCRPQMSTVKRMAAALEIDAAGLWPDKSKSK